MGLMSIYQKPNTRKAAKEHETYPFFVAQFEGHRPNKVWAANITYLPMRRGLLYLVAIMDWHGMPPLNWSTVMFEKRRTENGEQAAQARGNSSEVAAG